MAYSKDITEEIPYVLSNPAISVAYSQSGMSYDIAVNGMPFFLASSDANPYRRETAQYRKQQIDQTAEAGEQTLTGWWLRSQASFHSGCGIKYYDPTSASGNEHYRYLESKGLDVWTKGQVTLLKSSTEGHIVTGAVLSNGRKQQHMRSIKWGSTQGVLLHDEYDVDKIDGSGTVTHFIDYITGVGVYPVFAICDDGTYAYWVTNVTSGGTTKLTMFKKPLTGSSASTADEVQMFQDSAILTNATMEYVKDRIVLCANNKVYEISPSATGLPSPLYTHPASTHLFTSITASGSAIYISGYNGIQSTIHKYTLSTAGVMPTLTSAVVAAELPVGEVVHRIFYYLGFMMIGTNKGVRAAAVSDTDGSLTYGPLIVETSQPCYDFAAKDKYIWAATGVVGEPGLVRFDLGNEVETLRFAYANDVYYAGVTGHKTTACAFLGDDGQLGYAAANDGAANGHVYITSLTTLLPEGYLTTGRIRFSTLEPKVFKFIKPIIDDTNGSVSVSAISSVGNEYTIGNFAEDDVPAELSIVKPTGAQEYLSFKFILSRSTHDSTIGPILSGYQLKALPSVKRQRLIQYTLECYDHITDVFGNQVGYDGMAYDNIVALEALEDLSDTVRVQDFRTNESFLGLIEEARFIDPTPPDKVNPNFGGTLLLTVRKL